MLHRSAPFLWICYARATAGSYPVGLVVGCLRHLDATHKKRGERYPCAMKNTEAGSSTQGQRLLGYAEAAEVLGVSQYTLRRWACQGRIGFTRVGRKIVRFSLAQLQAFLDAGVVEPRAS